MEKPRARPARCSKSIAVAAAALLSAALLSWPNPAPAAEGAPRDEAASGSSTAVLRGTRPPGPPAAAPAKTAARRRAQERDLGFERTLPYGSGWNNDLNWEGMNSEPQIDTIVR